MILGLGIDVCPVQRIQDVLERHGDLFADRVFTEAERSYAGDGRAKEERLAARFAAKEATIKALGGPLGLRWKDMEVIHTAEGAPGLRLHGKAAEQIARMGVARTWISLTHAGGVAVAVVILEGA